MHIVFQFLTSSFQQSLSYISFLYTCSGCMFHKQGMHCAAVNIISFTASTASFSLAVPEVSCCLTNRSISGYKTTRDSPVCNSYYLFMWLSLTVLGDPTSITAPEYKIYAHSSCSYLGMFIHQKESSDLMEVQIRLKQGRWTLLY